MLRIGGLAQQAGVSVRALRYYEQQGLKRIVEYCQRDVVTVARLLMRFRYEPDFLEDKDVIIATQP